MSSMTEVTLVTTINNLPDELLSIISISAGPTEYCNLRRAMKRVWLYTTGREDHCIKHFLVTKVDEYGSTRTTLCDNLHSIFDQPAITSSDRTQMWYQHGNLHRDNDLPAVIHSDGTQEWYQHNKKHRDNDLPAVIFSTGSKMWYQHGDLHRDNDAPTCISYTRSKSWYNYNKYNIP